MGTCVSVGLGDLGPDNGGAVGGTNENLAAEKDFKEAMDAALGKLSRQQIWLHVSAKKMPEFEYATCVLHELENGQWYSICRTEVIASGSEL